MQLSVKGEALIKGFETLRLTAYVCPAGKWTIGWGHTGADVHPWLTIDLARAQALFDHDVARFEETVTRVAGACTQGQFDALVSFTFNEGPVALIGSHLLQKHLAGDYAGAAEQFAVWKWAHVHGQLTVLEGLVKRRAAEAALYRGDDQ